MGILVRYTHASTLCCTELYCDVRCGALTLFHSSCLAETFVCHKWSARCILLAMQLPFSMHSSWRIVGCMCMYIASKVGNNHFKSLVFYFFLILDFVLIRYKYTSEWVSVCMYVFYLRRPLVRLPKQDEFYGDDHRRKKGKRMSGLNSLLHLFSYYNT